MIAFGFMKAVLGLFFNGIQHLGKLRANENRNDGRRSLVNPQAQVVLCRRNISMQQIGMHTDGLYDVY